MMNFNRDRRPARNSDRPMYKAVCASCGQDCDVPFRPSGDRPVYCSRCFDEKGRPDSRGSNRSDRGDRRMFEAICDKCGNKCTVPFQPTSGKPIFCSRCFEEKNDRGSRSNENYKEHFIALNNKLDKILRILEPVVVKKTKAKKAALVKK